VDASLSAEYMKQLENQPCSEVVLADDLDAWWYSAEELRVMNSECVVWDSDGRWVPVYGQWIEDLLVSVAGSQDAAVRHQVLES